MLQKHSTPEGLRTFLNAVKSDLLDPRNRNKEDCNLPIDELNALKDLINLQKDRQIVVKACDKGAGIIILDFNDYVKACYEHLVSETADGQPYYIKVNELEIERAKDDIEKILKEGLEKEILSKSEFDAMSVENKGPGRFYCNFKMHKKHDHKQAPPVRPITSGSGSLTEGIGTYVEHYIKHGATSHQTYLKDTPDFLRQIAKINSGPKLDKQTMLATFDVDGLFTNILHRDGLQSLQEQLQEDSTIEEAHKKYILKLMEVILKNNFFSFHDSHWKQLIGAAMGSRPVPAFADGFMARTIDPEIQKLSEKYNKEKVKSLPLLKRFLDDYISLFVGTTKNLHRLLEEINKIHPQIRLTMSHTSVPGELLEDQCDCEKKSEIPFLDTLCSLKDGKIETDLYIKPTDRNQYLLPTSCHPKQTTKSIPKSLGLRIECALTQ